MNGDPGALGAHVTQQQAKYQDQDLATIQQPKIEVLPAQDHLLQQKHVLKYFVFHGAIVMLRVRVNRQRP